MKFSAPRTGSSTGLGDDFFYLSLLAVLALVVWVAATDLALQLHRNFLTIACDTAVLENAIVNTMHGHWFDNNGAGGPNILGSHTTFLLLLVLPFYVVAPYPETLFALQTAGVYSTVIPLFLVARELGLLPLQSFFIAASALASSLLMHMAMAPFHLETWIAAASFWAFRSYLRRQLLGFITWMLVAVCCGEQAALIFISLGVSLYLVDDGRAWRRRFGLAAFALGVLWLAFDLAVVNPLISGASTFNIFAYNYANWGVKSAAGLPAAILSSPLLALANVLGIYRWLHLFSVVGLLLVTAFLSRRSLLLLLPLPAYLLMSGQQFYLYFHAYYYSFLYVAGYLGLILFLRRFEPAGRVAVFTLAAYVLAAVLTLSLATGYYVQLSGAIDEPFSTTLREAFAKIPSTATVYGPHRYSVYLSNRENFVLGDLSADDLDFDKRVEAEFPQTNVHASSIDFIVADYWTDQCGWRQGFPDANKTQARQDAVNRLVASGKWSPVFQQQDVVILQRVR